MKISCLLLWLSRRDAREKRLIIVLAERTARRKAETIKPSNLCGREAHVLGKDTTQEVAIVNEHFKSQYAAMAQQVEHVLGKDEVTGSNPVSSSIYGTVQTVSACFFRANRILK